MNKFEVALDEFFREELDPEGLLMVFDQTVAQSPQSAPELMSLLQQRYHEGGFPTQLYELFKKRFERLSNAEADVSFYDVTHIVHQLPPHLRSKGDHAEGGEERTRVVKVPRKGPGVSARETEKRGPVSVAGSQVAGSGDIRAQETKHKSVGIGTRLKNRFVLEAIIARGGMGVIYKARDLLKEEAKDQESLIVVKVLNEAFKPYPEAFVIFQREAKKAQKLAHPNVVNVYDFDRDDTTGVIFMTMELLEGESLGQIIDRMYPGTLPLERALSIVKGMSEALSYAHQQHIIHSDCKPGNIILTKQGVVKVLDFGIARVARLPGLAQQDDTLPELDNISALTPSYASCEMLEKDEPDPRDDVYALACITYELLTGRHPFNRVPCTEARDTNIKPPPPKGLTREQWRGLLHALAFDRENRTKSVALFLEEMGLASKPPVVPKWAIAFLGGLALLAVSLWVYEFLMDDTSGTTPIPIEELDPDIRADVEKYLVVAETHMSVGNMQEALDMFRMVFELHAGNEGAIKGIRRIAEGYEREARQRQAKGDLKTALAMVEAGLLANPKNSELLALKKQIEQELP